MPICTVYVGAIDDANFSWDPAAVTSPYSNLPRRLGPDFPPAQHMGAHGAWSLVLARIESGVYVGLTLERRATLVAGSVALLLRSPRT